MIDYPKPPKSNEPTKRKETLAKKYQDIVESHPVEVTHQIKQQKKKKDLGLQYEDSETTIDSPEIKNSTRSPYRAS